jgi:hypothetical protein
MLWKTLRSWAIPQLLHLKELASQSIGGGIRRRHRPGSQFVGPRAPWRLAFPQFNLRDYRCAASPLNRNDVFTRRWKGSPSPSGRGVGTSRYENPASPSPAGASDPLATCTTEFASGACCVVAGEAEPASAPASAANTGCSAVTRFSSWLLRMRNAQILLRSPLLPSEPIHMQRDRDQVAWPFLSLHREV